MWCLASPHPFSLNRYLILPGELVGVFGAFYSPESGETEEIFMQIIDKYV